MFTYLYSHHLEDYNCTWKIKTAFPQDYKTRLTFVFHQLTVI